ncbi:T-box transcription factor TBX19 [Cynoglossus semilaevis]|uniref:T-box transcription factor TBX19 n=1 Tax=Cynoglossus semilaevis TaxID=244447 RepID=UPI000D62ACEF|nr:T-box transcription factor TBX19 [Cynoglossus semilaevis]
MSRLLSAVESELQVGGQKGDSTERDVRVTLEDAELWRKFQSVTNEMIVTKNGRRECHSEGQSEGQSHTEGCGDRGIYIHPDSPNFGAHWMKAAVTFNKVKLTNKIAGGGQIMLNSLHKYEPQLNIVCVGSRHRLVSNISFRETQFIAVTAYQNEEITALKIKYNPFAKAFLDTKDRNRGGRSLTDSSDNLVSGIQPFCVPGWSMCSAAGDGSYSYHGSPSLTSRPHHGYKHHVYPGRHAPYSAPYPKPCMHSSDIQVFDGRSTSPCMTTSCPSSFTSNSSLTATAPPHYSSQFPCLWTVGCSELSPVHSPCNSLHGPINNENLMQHSSHGRGSRAVWCSPPDSTHSF